MAAASHAPRSVVVSSSSPAAAIATAGCVVDTNTTFVQADPATFRALVQKLTGAPSRGRSRCTTATTTTG
uniref:VQ domain-containing protein n=1 Tax=Oryza barthii TaxID=65489 RepID=A0A0D3G0W0_9ORYZ